MGWVKLDDSFFLHPKALGAGRDARDVWLVGLCWSAQQQTDGLVPAHALTLIGSLAGVVDIDQAAQRLTEVGLWENAPDGWIIHDFLEHQTSRAHRDLWKAKERERKQRTRNVPKDDAGPRSVRADSTRNPRTRKEEKRRQLSLSSADHAGPVDNTPWTTTTTTTRTDQAMRLLADQLAARYCRDGDVVAYAHRIVASDTEHRARLEALAEQQPTWDAEQLVGELLSARTRKPTATCCAICGATTHNAASCILNDEGADL